MSAGDPSPGQAVPQTVARGTVLMVLFKLVERSIGFVSVLILARLLTPSDFGLVAMASSVVAMIELMSAFGFDTALIQRSDAKRTHFDTAWTFQVLFGTASAALLLALALPAADFYRDPRVSYILPVLALGALIQGLENIGPVMFRKSLDFKREFVFLLAKRLVSFAVTIAMALIFRNYWALVIGTVAGRAATTLMSYAMHDYRPRLSLAASAELFHFTKWLLISNLLGFLQQNADKFILGRTIGARPLGLYNIANEIAALPATVLIAPINRAVYPVYAKLATDLPALRAQFLAVYGQIAMIAVPTSVGIACAAEPVVRVLLGTQWLESIPLLQLFIVCGLAGALQSNLYSLIVALGHPKANTLMSAGMLVLCLPALVVASLHYGALGAAWVHLAMSVLVLIPLHVVFFKLTGTSVRGYLGRQWRPALSSAVMGAAMLVCLAVPAVASGPAVLQLALASVIGAIVYVAGIGSLWWAAGKPQDSAEASILDRVLPMLARFRARRAA
ncbi:MAG: lipopolysaccharide biosynthesis protein [Rhodoferax sp.]|nr:lipopolysaccharide biosynthesis protein [Rhodoferax sp.]